MTVTTTSMRVSFPDMTSATFPDALLQDAIDEATALNDVYAWPADTSTYSLYDRAIEWHARSIAMDSVRRFASSSGGGTGDVSSMSTLVGSVSYNLTSSSLKALSEIALARYNDLCRKTQSPLSISG